MVNKKIKIVGTILALVVIISGCGLKTGDEKTRTYNSANGKIQIPRNPQKVVADYYVGNLLALNANLVGADLRETSPAWKDKVKNIKAIGDSLETVASLKPDLIITINSQKVAQYSKIAPTVYIPYLKYNEESIITELGKILNKQNAATKLLEEFNNDVNKLRKEIKNKATTYTIYELKDNGDLYLYGNHYSRLGYVIYDKLNLKGTKFIEKNILTKSESWLKMNEELLNDYTGDIVLLSTPDAKKVNNKILDSKTFKNTKAYKTKKVYYIDTNLFYHNDIISLKEEMKQFEQILKEQ